MCILDCLLVSATIFYMNKAKIWMGVVTSLHCSTTLMYSTMCAIRAVSVRLPINDKPVSVRVIQFYIPDVF